MDKKHWYDNNVLVIILSFVIFPIGLYGLWKNAKLKKSIKIIITVLVFFMCVGYASNQVKTPKEIVQNSGLDGSVYQVQDYLKTVLKDPDSVKYEKWGKVLKNDNGYTVWVQFRSKNSFGGYVKSMYSFNLDSQGHILSFEKLY
jgi:hypothetical protein